MNDKTGTAGPGETARYFNRLYGASNDPYGLRDRWYEERKRALLLAALTRRRYASAYEPGCGAAELTADLALRCDAVLASDFTQRAVDIAAERTRDMPNVRVERHTLAQDWPDAAFDLIVLSEVGYFLDDEALHGVVANCDRTLAPGGTLVACHWLPDFDERRQSTEVVHMALNGLGLPRTVVHREDDFLMQLWCRDPASVAQAEGIR